MKKFWSRALFILLALGLISGSLMSCSNGDDGKKDKKEQSDPVIPETVTTLSVGAGKTYTTVQSALDKIMADNMTDTVKVEVDPGTYEEFVFYTGSATVILEGQGTAEFGTDVVIKQNNSGNTNSMESLAGSHGVTNGYFRGATRFNGSCNIILKNLTIQNTYSRSANNGSNTQAEALVFSSTGKLIANNCSFLGHQDTLYIGSQGNRSWFYKCQIKGDVDFIWGYADVALYEECEIYAIGDDNKLTDTLSASRAMVENVEANKGIVIMNSNIHIADGVTLTYARNSGADTTAAFFNNVFLSDGENGTGTIASTLYGAKPNYEVYDANGDMVIGWMDGKNYTDAAKTTLVNTSARLEGTGALADRYINREYSGRWVILNRGWDFTNKKFRTASKIWDISEFEKDFNATADVSKGQIFIEPVAAQKVVSGESVTFKAYDVNGTDVTSSVTWANTEKSNVTENAGTIVKSFDGGVLVTNATSDTAVVDGTVTVTATSGDFTDTAYVYVIPVYIAADTVTLAAETGSVAQGSSISITGDISFSGDATAEVSDTSTVWTVSDTSVAQIFNKTDNKLLGTYTSTTCDVVVYGVKAGSTTITAASADGGSATYTLTVTDSTVYYLPTFAGVYVNTDVQSGKYGTWNGILIDAVTNNSKNGSSAKMGLKQGNNRMQTRNVILNVPVTSDATIKVTLETPPQTVATATTASTYAYNGLYADGTKIVYTGAVYKEKDGSSTITEAAYNALGAEAQAAYEVSEKPYYTIGFDFETQAATASLTDLTGKTNANSSTGIDSCVLNDLTEAKWCQIGPFGSTDVYVTEIAITPESSDKYSYQAAAPLDVAIAFTDTELEVLDVNGTNTSSRTASVTGTDASSVTVEYTSSDTAVATVDAATGAVTGVAMGYATITATIPSNSDSTEFATASYSVLVRNTASAGASYKIALTGLKLPKNSNADFGQIVGTSCFWNDSTHGWQVNQDGTLKFAVAGASTIKVGGCEYGKAGTLTLSDGTTSVTGAYSLDCSTPAELVWEGTDAATLTLTYTGGSKAYIPYIQVVSAADAGDPKPATTYAYDFDDGANYATYASDDGVVVISATGGNQTSGHGAHLALNDTFKIKVAGNSKIVLYGCQYGADSVVTVTGSAGTELGTITWNKGTACDDKTSWEYTGNADTLTFTVTSGGNTYLHGLKLAPALTYDFDDGANYATYSSDDGVVVISATGGNQTSGHGAHLALNDTFKIKVGSAVTITLLGCQYGANSTVTVTNSTDETVDTITWNKGTGCDEATSWAYTGNADTLTFTVTSGGNTYLHGLKISE